MKQLLIILFLWVMRWDRSKSSPFITNGCCRYRKVTKYFFSSKALLWWWVNLLRKLLCTLTLFAHVRIACKGKSCGVVSSSEIKNRCNIENILSVYSVSFRDWKSKYRLQGKFVFFVNLNAISKKKDIKYIYLIQIFKWNKFCGFYYN